MSYGKVKDTFWTDKKVQSFSDDAKMLALYLLTGPHRNILGCMRIPDGYLVADLKWSSERISDAIRMLCEKGFICRDDDGWTLVLNQLRHDPIKIPNHARGAIAIANTVPPDSPIYQELVPRLVASLKAINMVSEWHPHGIAIPAPLPAPAPAPAPAPGDAGAMKIAATPSGDDLEIQAVLRAKALHPKVLAALGAAPNASPDWLAYGALTAMLEADATPDLILETCKAIGAQAPPGSIASWKYVRTAVENANVRKSADEQSDQAETERSAGRVASVVERLRARSRPGDIGVPGGDADPILSAVPGG